MQVADNKWKASVIEMVEARPVITTYLPNPHRKACEHEEGVKDEALNIQYPAQHTPM